MKAKCLLKLEEVKSVIDKLDHPNDLSKFGFRRYRASNSSYRRIWKNEEWVVKYNDPEAIEPHPESELHPKTPVVKTLEHKGFIIQPLLLDFQTAMRKDKGKAGKIQRMSRRWDKFNREQGFDADLHEDNFGIDKKGVVRAIDW